ncbi:DUF3082 domain-containing protein [Synechococcales cyanobacterium C]|uniref:DUF3082 domain-containing protein n=1 Tax=Petrachloros mirabilis ULC683 TaxID=2781853 RepID=A0A8K2A8M9_9CYAN|nr:DUF3082 domain-containing protein [Petrachloros mirabilis]NCJ07270.1 DUF3082 domain-containing protein [Petrachloros mirabilis ULC683]
MADPHSEQPTPLAAPVTPLRALSGAFLSGTLGLLLYRLTESIAQSFAAHPFQSSNQIALNLSIAIRTLVVGLSTLATGIFAIAALGLVALAAQMLLRRLHPPQS